MNSTSGSVRAVAVPPEARTASGLSPINFADAYAGHAARPGLTAMQLARAMFEQPSPAATALMAARNAIVGPLGLKTPDPRLGGDAAHAGIFPILSDSGPEMLLGLDDRHLDFRIWLSVREGEGGSDVVMSTLLRFNGISGRIYLAAILPFHYLLSRLMLQRALASLARIDNPT
ncbi:MAG: DUF2867 domain-containing protein [Burkholderiales bacterium]|nr:DUF2867 domain-containing protein [Burkholderiales bacterium]